MNIGLLDIDSKMANVALMKISAYHKFIGDSVKWHDPLFDKPDKLYASKIFTFTPDYNSAWPDCEIIKGGTGYDITAKLPEEIENCHPDYSIYPNCDYSIQFFSRGCIRNCPFCIVPQKEGKIQAVKPMDLNPNGKYIEVLDNNFFANPAWIESIKWLIKCNQKVTIKGFDIRLLNDYQAMALGNLKFQGQIYFAWDNPKDDIIPMIKLLLEYLPASKLACYVLIGYWSTPEQDLYRVEELRELGIDAFAMAYNKDDEYQHRFARWVNHKATFKSCSFENYKE